MQTERILRRFAGLLPVGLRSVAKRMYYRDRHWAHPALERFGTVQGLYYWTAAGALATLLLLQNYFSALYPGVDTETAGSVTLFDSDPVQRTQVILGSGVMGNEEDPRSRRRHQ